MHFNTAHISQQYKTYLSMDIRKLSPLDIPDRSYITFSMDICI